MLTWVWNNFEMSVPEEWEMLYFAKSPDFGRCGFADRYRYRLEFNWKKVPGEPDFERMMSDYDAKLRTDGVMTGIHRTRSGPWKGVEGRMDTTLTSRYGRYFPEEKSLIEIVFLWPEKKDSAVVKTILNSVGCVPVVREQFRRWKAFGMELLCDSTRNA